MPERKNAYTCRKYQAEGLTSEQVLEKLPITLMRQGISYQMDYSADEGEMDITLKRFPRDVGIRVSKFRQYSIALRGNQTERRYIHNLLKKCLETNLIIEK
ncbi:MAG: hypothetical protein AABX54_03585 [Nanoarchaeota archaeon]